MASEYIGRGILLNTLDEVCRVACPYSERRDIAQYVKCGACPLGSAFDFIDDIPAADVVERKRGYWIMSENGYGLCSNCSKCKLDLASGAYSNFCPNCGARMVTEDV